MVDARDDLINDIIQNLSPHILQLHGSETIHRIKEIKENAEEAERHFASMKKEKGKWQKVKVEGKGPDALGQKGPGWHPDWGPQPVPYVYSGANATPVGGELGRQIAERKAEKGAKGFGKSSDVNLGKGKSKLPPGPPGADPRFASSALQGGSRFGTYTDPRTVGVTFGRDF